jgi:hypothetical protein
VPEALRKTYPYNASAYVFLQQLRAAIFELGILEFPGLPLNRQNHTLAQRAPQEHAYSANPYLTDWYQSPHQDTPPYPTAFWLGAPRRYFATWVLSGPAAHSFYAEREARPHATLEQLHRELVPQTLARRSAVLLNREPGLLLIDNSQACQLSHARTAQWDAIEQAPDFDRDVPMYAFNEVGLLNYLRTLDERRGVADIDPDEIAQVHRFLARERLEGAG